MKFIPLLRTAWGRLGVLVLCGFILGGCGKDGALGPQGIQGDKGDTGTTGTTGTGLSNITSNTTWTKANSPYTLYANLVIVEGVTLTIEPGVVVKCNPDTTIYVDGGLISQGTSADPITFTSTTSSGWKGLRFGTTTSGNVIRYCVIEKGTQEANVTAYGTVSLQNCKLRAGQHGVVVYSGGNIVLSNCDLSNNTIDGAYYYNSSGSMVATQTTFTNNGSTGIYVLAGTVALTNCTITGHLSYGISFNSGALRVSKSIITDNLSKGIYVYTSTASSVSVNDSHLFNSGATFDVYNQGSANVDFTNNWWNTTTTATIDGRIQDKNDVSSQGTVDYSGFTSGTISGVGGSGAGF